jgi:hypothetical protein
VASDSSVEWMDATAAADSGFITVLRMMRAVAASGFNL